MSYSLSSVSPQIAALLNDSIQSLYTNAVLLPYAKLACRDLQLEYELNGLLVLEKKSTFVTVVAGTLDLNSVNLIPTDMLEPQKLGERLAGSQDSPIPMTRRQWEPDIKPTSSMRYWSYREQNIFFPGATTDRDIQIYYLKDFIKITDENTPITVNNTDLYFIHRTAALAAQYIGENPTRAQALNQDAQIAMDKVTRIGVKSKQGTRTRRRPFVLVGRRRWF